jgi:hypothetical protein
MNAFSDVIETRQMRGKIAESVDYPNIIEVD